PTDVRVLDAAVEGEPPIELTVQNAPWVHSIWDPNVQIEAPFDGTFVPGVEESPGCSGPGQKNGAGAAQAVRLDLRADVAGSVMTSALRPVAPTLQASETDADPAIAGWDSQVPPGLVECPGRAVIHPQRVAPTYDGARARQTGPGRATALVYQNTYTQFDFYYAPGANVTVGDDMQLAGTARIFNRYEHVCVWSNPGTPNYDVTMELWDGSAAGPTSPISGTACTVANIPPGTVWDAASLCDSGVGPGDTLPDLVWMLVTFSTNEAGWVVAQEAEVGFTDDVYWENGSLWWWEGNPYAGLCGWVYCDDDVSTVGACCLSLTDCFDGTTSSECEVLGGIWMGGGTDCTTVTCQCFSDAECDDGNACTTDICDLANGVCQNTPTYDPATMCCDPATGQLTVIDDGEPCTDDICDPANGTVAHLPLPNGSDCDDGDACAVFDVCFNGVCAGVDCTTIECLSAADCIECPGGQCDPATGTCSCGPIPGSQTVQPITLVNSTALTSHTVVPLSLPAGPCDGQPAGTVCRPAAGECDVDEVCDGVTPDCPPDAYAPAGTDCGDPGDTDCDNPDTCDGAGSCLPNTEPDGTPCDDGLVCTTDDVCDGLLGLCTGTDINGIPCTVDADCPPPGFCVPDLGQCLCVDEQMRFHPVDATGNVVSLPGMGDESAKIVLSEGGVDVTLFFQVSNWDAFGRDLGALQGTLDSTSLLGGVPGNPGTIPGVDLIPRGSSTGMGFEGAFQALKVCASLPSDPVGSSDLLSRCDTSADCPPTHPFCVDRWDYVFYQLNSVPAVSTSSPNYVWGAASFPPCRTDPSAGERFYLGTLVLEVPPEATGTYNVAFLPDDALTEMYDCSGLLIPGPVTRAGTIEIQAGGVFNGLGVPANPDHQTKKHRYISVDATTNLPQEVSLKVEVVEMRRCTGDPRRSCLVDADCRNACQNDLDA
ncbi:MAG: hypothetical protein ACE5HE_14480, partial [Phycisphaerae bacterium]